MKQVARLCFAATLALSLGSIHVSIVQASEAVLIRAKHLYTMNGEVLENAEVLVRDGRIVGIGDTIRPLGEFEVLEVDTLMPGMIDASSSAGLRGGSAELTREVSPEFETADSIDWRSRDFAEAISQGITAVNVMPSTDNVFCGYSCLVKTAGSDLSVDVDNDRIISQRSGLAIAVCSDPASGNQSRSRPDSIYVRMPTNRMGVVWIIRNRLQQVRDQQSRGEIEERFVEPLRQLLAGETLAFGVSRTSYDIETWVGLAKEYGIKPIVFGGHEAYRVVDLLTKENVPVVYTALNTGSTRGEEQTELFWNTPGKLEQAGLSVALAGSDPLTQARFAARFGMSTDAALAAVTTVPARLLGAEQRLGRIAADFDADLVALDGPPLEFTTNIQWVMVDGKVQASQNGK